MFALLCDFLLPCFNLPGSCPATLSSSSFHLSSFLQLPTPNQILFESSPKYPYGEGTSGDYKAHNQDSPGPAHNHNNKRQEDDQAEETNSEPLFYYQDSHVQESIDQCNLSIIGKILAEKPISAQVLYNSLFGIWCKHMGLKITELEGKLLQIKMDRKEDIHRILKGSSWIIRNCWLIVHNWSRNLDISSLNFTQVPLWIQFWGLPLHCKSLIMGQEMGSQLGQVLDVGIYEYLKKARIVKIKIMFDINQPIRAGMYIGNDQDGIN